jgi:hypothetical protein
MTFRQVFITREQLIKRKVDPDKLRGLIRSEHNRGGNFAILPNEDQNKLKDLLSEEGLDPNAETEVILDAERQDGYYFRQSVDVGDAVAPATE